jgi:hypothetical protein
MGINGKEGKAQDVGATAVRRDYIFLAKFFNIQINGLSDRFVMEIRENVTPGTEKRQFSKIALENRKNMRS